MNCTKVKKCDSCEPIMINGVFCHERGCPNTPKECKWCGQMFNPEGGYRLFCDDTCFESYND